MEVAEAKVKENISKDAVRPKIFKKSQPIVSTSSQGSFYHRPTTPKVKKGQTHPVSYLAQAGHIYYPPSSPLAQIHDVHRRQSAETGAFGGSTEQTYGGNNALKQSLPFSTHHRYEVIEEDRTPQSFIRRVHELCTPQSCGASKVFPPQNPTLTISSSARSISSPDVFNNRTKNPISKQLSTSSADSAQSIVTRPITTQQFLSGGNDSENIPSPTTTNNDSPECTTVCDKATNTCEAVCVTTLFYHFQLPPFNPIINYCYSMELA